MMIDEMALVALISGVCSKGGTLDNKKYPVPNIKINTPTNNAIDINKFSSASGLTKGHYLLSKLSDRPTCLQE